MDTHKSFAPVVIESPYAGDIDRNVAYALRCIEDCLQRGKAPFAGHLIYPRVWDDADSEQRAAGIAAHVSWIPFASSLVVYTDYGITSGMIAGIDVATRHGVPTEYRKIGQNDCACDAIMTE